MNLHESQNWSFWGRSMFTDAELEAIHNATLDLLENPGVSVEDQEAIDYFVSAGAIVDKLTGYVRIPKWLTNECIRISPDTYTMAGRIRESDYAQEDGRVGFTSIGVANSVRDLITGKVRPSTKQDCADFAHLVEQLEHHDIANYILSATDQIKCPELHAFQAHFVNSTKHLIFCANDKITAKGEIAIAAEAVGGLDNLVKHPIFTSVPCPVSPLGLTKEVTSGTIEFAKNRLPVLAMPMVLSGGTGPVTMIGTLVQHNAEVLSTLVLTQIVSKGTPFGYGSCTSAMDLRRAVCCTGSVEHAMFSAATARLAQYYKLPFDGPGGWTDSKANDLQAGYERAISALLPALAGAKIIFGGGCLSGGLTADYAGLVADDELFAMIQFILKGFNVSESDMALDIIREVGPRGEYVTHPHTFQNMRESQFWPQLCNRDSLNEWGAAGSKTMDEVAFEKAKELLAKPNKHPLSEATIKRMDDIIYECEKEANA